MNNSSLPTQSMSLDSALLMKTGFFQLLQTVIWLLLILSRVKKLNDKKSRLLLQRQRLTMMEVSLSMPQEMIGTLELMNLGQPILQWKSWRVLTIMLLTDLYDFMIIKSFRRQLESVFSLAAYKATGLLLPCNCNFYQPKHISASGISFNVLLTNTDWYCSPTLQQIQNGGF